MTTTEKAVKAAKAGVLFGSFMFVYLVYCELAEVWL